MDYTSERSRFPIKLQWGALVYFLLFCYALLMTQLLRSPISAVFFWFMLTALPLSFLIMLIGRAAIQVYVMTDKNQTQKHSPVEYEIRIINTSPIPYPFIEAVMSKPREDGVRCLYQRLVLSLIPFGNYSVKNTVFFRYRGLYEIGIHDIYICDPLRIFKMRVDIDNFSNVTVFPRKLTFENNSESAVSDLPSPMVKALDSRDKSEISNIREYRMGDPLKSVHWKLSSKAEELQVKDYNTNNDRHTYIFVDLAKPTPLPEKESIEKKESPDESKAEKKPSLKARISKKVEEARARKKKKKDLRRRVKGSSAKDIETIDMIDSLIRETSTKPKAKSKKDAPAKAEDTALSRIADLCADPAKKDIGADPKSAWGGTPLSEFEDEMAEFCADSVVEIAIAAMNGELSRGNACTVVWYDKRSESGFYAMDVSSSASLDYSYSILSGARIVDESKRVSSLSDIIDESINVTVKIVTSNIDPKSVEEYTTVPQRFGGAGTGCVCEVLLFNPCEKYTSPSDRLEFAAMTGAHLKSNGLSLCDIKECDGFGASAVYITNELT